VCGSEMERFPLVQPAGFRTTYTKRDYNGLDDLSQSRSLAQLAADVNESDATQLDGLEMAVLEQTQLLTVNDNNGSLFEIHKQDDGSYACTDPSLYAEPLPGWVTKSPNGERVAIGDVRRTDVLALLVNSSQISTKTVVTDSAACPGGLPALHSFSQLLRRSAHAFLDIDETELIVGLQPTQRDGVLTHRIYIADALDNGAGFSVELGHPETMRRLLRFLRDDVGRNLEADSHASVCSSSCPQCLRSYDNRFVHWALDWRLGLDAADLALGRPLDISHWRDRMSTVATRSVSALRQNYPDLETVWTSSLPVIASRDRSTAVVVGHPLWARQKLLFTQEQSETWEHVQSLGYSNVSFSDPFTLDRSTESLLRQLMR
jgi:DEAD/DEAH box helicase domain-containing protein